MYTYIQVKMPKKTDYEPCKAQMNEIPEYSMEASSQNDRRIWIKVSETKIPKWRRLRAAIRSENSEESSAN